MGHFLVNETKDKPPRLSLSFSRGKINFYACAIKIIEGDINEVYDWTADVMNVRWDEKKAKKKLLALPDKLICDVLLNQDIFSGVGNIIKNEVLYRVRIHPESKVKNIPVKKLERSSKKQGLIVSISCFGKRTMN